MFGLEQVVFALQEAQREKVEQTINVAKEFHQRSSLSFGNLARSNLEILERA